MRTRLPSVLLVLAAALPAAAVPARAGTTEDGKAAPSLPDSLEGWIRRHDAMVANGHGEEALAEVHARIEAEPKNPEPRYLLGRLLGNQEKIEEARVQFQGALELDINYAPAWRGLAKVHLMQKDYESAVREARKAYDIDPKSDEGRVLLVECLYQKGERPRAYQILEEALARDPEDNELRFFYATLLAGEHRSRDAERELRAILASDPTHAPAQETLVALLASSGRQGEAVAACREALKKIDRDPQLWFLLRNLCLDGKDYGGAVAASEGLLACDLSEGDRKAVEDDLVKIRRKRDEPPEDAGPPTVEAMLEMLKSPDAAKRREGIRSLYEQAEGGNLPPAVVKAVTDSDEIVRIYAVRLIGRFGDPGTAGILGTLLFHPDGRDSSDAVRANAARALGRMARRGEIAGLPVLLQALDDPSPEVLRAAVQGIADATGKVLVKDPEAPIPEKERPKVREAYRRWWLGDPTGRMWRLKAVAAVGRARDRNLAMYVVPWLREDDDGIRGAVVRALADLTGSDAWLSLPMETEADREAAVARAYERLKDPLPERK